MLTKAEIETKTLITQFLKCNDRAVELALVGLYARQTPSERATSSTVESNGRGFRYDHAEFGSSLARWVKSGRRLTIRQIRAARPMVCYYWRQVATMAEITALRFPITHKVSGEHNLCDIIARLDRFQAFPGVAA